MNLLLSIKPKYVEKIIDGTKKYEFRKVGFRDRDIDFVYIYASSPIKKIVGKFEVKEIIEGEPPALWEELKDYSGIDEEEFFSYFRGKSRGLAIGIDNLDIFKKPLDPNAHLQNFTPPQSFKYIEEMLVSLDE